MHFLACVVGLFKTVHAIFNSGLNMLCDVVGVEVVVVVVVVLAC